MKNTPKKSEFDEIIDKPPKDMQQRKLAFDRLSRMKEPELRELEYRLATRGVIEQERAEYTTPPEMLAKIRAGVMAGRVGGIVEDNAIFGHMKYLLDAGSNDARVINEVRGAFLRDINPGIIAQDYGRGEILKDAKGFNPQLGKIVQIRTSLSTLVREILPVSNFHFDMATSIADLHHNIGDPHDAVKYVRLLLESVTKNHWDVGKVIISDTCAPAKDWPRAVANAVECQMDTLRYGGPRARFYLTDEEFQEVVDEAGGIVIHKEIKDPQFSVRERHVNFAITAR